MESDSFIQRWSQCKRQSEKDAKIKSVPEGDEKTIILAQGVPVENVSDESLAIDAEVREDKADIAAAAHDGEPVALTMDDVERLKEGGSVAGFLLKGVSLEVKKAALCKLFQSDVFKVLDGLNDYDLDYSNTADLPAELIAGVRQWTKEIIEHSQKANFEASSSESALKTHESHTQEAVISSSPMLPSEMPLSENTLSLSKSTESLTEIQISQNGKADKRLSEAKENTLQDITLRDLPRS